MTSNRWQGNTLPREVAKTNQANYLPRASACFTYCNFYIHNLKLRYNALSYIFISFMLIKLFNLFSNAHFFLHFLLFQGISLKQFKKYNHFMVNAKEIHSRCSETTVIFSNKQCHIKIIWLWQYKKNDNTQYRIQ